MVMGKNMSPNLLTDKETIVDKFKSLKDFEDIANMLEIPTKKLWKILITSKEQNYSTFVIKKRNGNDRTIYAPKKNLSIIQKKFSMVLALVYANHPNSHGFIKGRSIKTNASKHVQQNYVLNFDLENYFENINFGRVRSMFIYYFGFNNTVSSTLANICCHYKGFLPQGASTSPIISNIISYKMDRELSKMAAKNNCIYSRYADDITFSTNRESFPKRVASLRNNTISLSNEIQSIVKRNGFLINDSKTRLSNKYERQTVTGITVNEKLNVNRKYIRRVRSILHSIEKNIDEIEIAKSMFNEKYKFHQRKSSSVPDMFDVLRGMISYIGQIKGKEDSVFVKLAKRYNKILEDNKELNHPYIRLPISKRKFQQDNTYVIESLYYSFSFDDGEKHDVMVGQGTGFLLKGIGLITNAHVFKEYIEMLEFGARPDTKIRINRSKYSSKSYYAKLLCYDAIKDIAILAINDIDIKNFGFNFNTSIEQNQKIQLVGYPDYRKNMDVSIKDGIVLGERYTDKSRIGTVEKRFEINANIYGGNSGGPVVNEMNEVIAVAVKGVTESGMVPSEVIPIVEVIELAAKEKIYVMEKVEEHAI